MRRVVIIFSLGVTLGLASHLAAQSPARPAFEVTSVKPSNPDAPAVTAGLRNGRYSATNVTLRELVLRAYDLNDSLLDGGPDWGTSLRFDVRATAADATTPMTAMRPMVQTLLADRFKLRVHAETRERPVYALMVARDDGQLGPNITRSTADCSKAEQDLGAAGPGGVLKQLQAGQGLPCAIMPVPARMAGVTMRANAASMAELATMLTSQMGRIVQDRTGLTGRYDWEMTFTRGVGPRLAQPSGGTPSIPPPPPAIQQPPGSDPPTGAPPPTVMIALEEQLGLKLESTRGVVEVLVIDSAALPDPD